MFTVPRNGKRNVLIVGFIFGVSVSVPVHDSVKGSAFSRNKVNVRRSKGNFSLSKR